MFKFFVIFLLARGLYGPICPVYKLKRDHLFIDKLFVGLLDAEASKHYIKYQMPKKLSSLSDDLILHIISYLSTEDIANVANTCLRLRKVVRQLRGRNGTPSSQYSIKSVAESDAVSSIE